jgi:hypothetical protein
MVLSLTPQGFGSRFFLHHWRTVASSAREDPVCPRPRGWPIQPCRLGYFYQVKNTPLRRNPTDYDQLPGGHGLSVRLTTGSFVDGVIRFDSWTDDKWNGVMFTPETVSPGVVNFQPGFYPVRPSPFLDMNPSLCSLMDSTGLTNAVHTLVLQFVRPNPIPFAVSPIVLATRPPVKFRVDNNPCRGVLAPPKVGPNTADACGILRYTFAHRHDDHGLHRKPSEQLC